VSQRVFKIQVPVIKDEKTHKLLTPNMIANDEKQAEVQNMSQIAAPYGNSSHVITPRAWLGKKVWCLTQEEYEEVRQRGKKDD
jgi:putative transposon-encoded protein